MAEPASQTPASASSPSSTAPTANGTNGSGLPTKAPKDKKCPFCGQAFTSSSLGRHLDLYIKPKNPKPPDGVHDVEKIRSMRGGITRRQPRVSIKGRNEEEQRSESNTPARMSIGGQSWAADAREDSRKSFDERDTAVQSPVSHRNGEKVNMIFNRMNWQSTGVINDLPPRQVDGSVSGLSSIAPGQQKVDEESIRRLAEEREIGKAAELALREVLGSVEAARYVYWHVRSKQVGTDMGMAGLEPDRLRSSTLTSTA